MGLFCVAKSFLRSGSLHDILALGEDALPVYASAPQLRETLRLRHQQPVLDCLAIPQPNEAGDRLDWYAPVEGKAVSWAAAGGAERASALKQLEECLSTVNDISRRARRSEKTGQRLFGMLLAKAMQFPDQNHVYLVDGKPVLTFWGFVKLDQKARANPLDCLRPPIPEIIPSPADAITAAPLPVRSPAPVINRPADSASAPEDVSIPAAPPASATATAAEAARPGPQPVALARRLRAGVWWMAPAAALLAALIFQMHGWLTNSHSLPPVPPQASADTSVTSPAPVGAKTSTADTQPSFDTRPAQPALSADKTAPTTAIMPAPSALIMATAPAITPPAAIPPATVSGHAADAAITGMPAADPADSPVTASQQSMPAVPVSAPADKNALRLPAQSVKEGDIAFLNGHWRVAVDSKEDLTGKAVRLDYQLKNGAGLARMRLGKKGVCRATIEAGLMKSGNLVIKSQARARCGDGSGYQMPQIICKQGPAGIADCQGRFDTDQDYPVMIKRENGK